MLDVLYSNANEMTHTSRFHFLRLSCSLDFAENPWQAYLVYYFHMHVDHSCVFYKVFKMSILLW